MKIRILENSLRLRLSQSEVQQLNTRGDVKQRINFGLSALKYSIIKKEIESIKSLYQSNEILILVPAKMVEDWANSDLISLQESISINEEENLKILIEKDFKCLTVRAGEDESDLFPNPEKSH